MDLFIEKFRQIKNHNLKAKISVIFLMLILTIFSFTIVSSAQADDGSLQIDTNIQSNGKEQKEIQYIEQEGELSKLFLDSTEAIIKKEQTAEKKQSLDERQNLFLVKTKAENLLETYQPLLFTTDTMVVHRKGYAVSVANRKTPISWQMITLSIFAFGVTCFSIYQLFKTRKT